MTEYQFGYSRRARAERMRALAWESGVFAAAAVWGYFSFAPARVHVFGLSGWGAVVVWGGLGLLNLVVTLNRTFATTFVDDEGLELRSFFMHRSIRWIHVSAISVEPRRYDHRLVLRIYRTIGYPLDVPGALAWADGGIAHQDLLDKAQALRRHPQLPLGPAREARDPGPPARPGP